MKRHKLFGRLFNRNTLHRRPATGVLLEALEHRVMLTASPFTTATFTSLPAAPDIVATTGQFGDSTTGLNGDNFADLIIKYSVASQDATPGSTTAAALLGNANGTFTVNTIATFTDPQSIDEMDTFDFNKDGRLDVAILSDDNNLGSQAIDVYLCNSNGTFTKTSQHFDLGVNDLRSSMTLLDMNGDGNEDLMLSHSSTLTVLIGNGNGTFVAPVSTTFPDTPIQSTQDLDGDGVVDVITNGINFETFSHTLIVYKGQASGTFNLTPVFNDTTGNYTFVATAQLTSDTRPDMIVYTGDLLHPGNPATVTILRNNGNATFAVSDSQEFTNGVYPYVVPQDLDKDGDADLVLEEGAVGSSAAIISHIERNDGNAVFTDVQQITLPGPQSVPFALDIDHDGFPDLVSHSFLNVSEGSQYSFYFNQGNATFVTPPVTLTPTPSTGAFGEPVDLNGDLKIDAIFSLAFNSNPGATDPINAFVNTTGRAFGPQVDTELGANTVPDGVIIDFDGDQKADIIVFQNVPSDSQPMDADSFKFWGGDGNGGFTAAPTTVSFGAGAMVDTNARLIDFDGNDSFDLLFTGDTPTGLYVSTNGTSGTPADNAGNTRDTARDIGALAAEQTFADAVNPDDTDDFYKFTLAQASAVSISLTNLGANADVRLLNSGGATVASSTNAGAAAEAISQSLAAGTYYIRVSPVGSASTNYTLAASAQEATPVISVTQGTTPITSGQETPINFPDAAHNQSPEPTITFTITNTGNAPLSIGSIGLPVGFDFGPGNTPVTVAPNQFATFQVVLDTSVVGVASGNVVILSNTGNVPGTEFDIPVIGQVGLSDALPDLSGEIVGITSGGDPVTPSSLLVPGDSITADLTVFNTGTADFSASTGDVTFYLSADTTLDTATDILVDTFTVKNPSIAQGGSGARSFKLTVPQVALPGSHFLGRHRLGAPDRRDRRDQQHRRLLVRGAGRARSGQRQRPQRQAHVPGTRRHARHLRRLGPGQFAVDPRRRIFRPRAQRHRRELQHHHHHQKEQAQRRRHRNHHAAQRHRRHRARLAIARVFPLASLAPLAVSQVSALDAAPSPLGKFLAKTARLIGAFDAPEGLKSLTLDSAGDQASIHIGAPAVADPKAGVTLALNLLRDVSITSDVPIKSFTAVEWQDSKDDAGNPTPDDPADLLSAPSIGSISIKGNKSFALDGDFEADVTTTGIAGALPAVQSLGAVKVAGSLNGGAWNIAGTAAGLTVGKNTGGFSLTTTAAGGLKTLKLNTVDSATLNLDGDLGAATSINWLDGSLTARSAKSIAIKGSKTDAGDLGADIHLLGGDAAAAKSALGSLSVAGTVRGATVRVEGNSGAITLGGTDGSRFLIGVAGGVDNPLTLADVGVATLASFTAKGSKTIASPFVNSLVAAGTITKASLTDVTTTAEADFGLTADILKSYTRTGGAQPVKLSKLDDPAARLPVPGEADRQDQFVVRIV